MTEHFQTAEQIARERLSNIVGFASCDALVDYHPSDEYYSVTFQLNGSTTRVELISVGEMCNYENSRACARTKNPR